MTEQMQNSLVTDEQAPQSTPEVNFLEIPGFAEVHRTTSEAAGIVWGVLDSKRNKPYDKEASTSALITETTALLAQSWFFSPESAVRVRSAQAAYSVELAKASCESARLIEHVVLPKIAGSLGSKRRPDRPFETSPYLDPSTSKKHLSQVTSLSFAASLVSRMESGARISTRDFEDVADGLGEPTAIGGNRFTKHRRAAQYLDAKLAEFESHAPRGLVLSALGRQTYEEITKMKFDCSLDLVGSLSTIVLSPQWRNQVDPNLKLFFRKQLSGQRALLNELVKTGCVNDKLATELLNDSLDQCHTLLERRHLLATSSADLLKAFVSRTDSCVNYINTTLNMMPSTPSLKFSEAKPAAETAPQPVMDAAQTIEVVAPTEAEAEAETDDTQEQVALLFERNAVLSEELDQLRKIYRSSNSQLKSTGLTTLSHAMQNGFTNEETGHGIDGISKPNTYRMLATLHGLRSFLTPSSEEKDMQAELQATLNDEQRLTLMLRGVRADLLEHGHNGFDTLSNELSEDTSWLKANHQALKELFELQLPAAQTAELCLLLDNLFIAEAATDIAEPQEPDLPEAIVDTELPVEEDNAEDEIPAPEIEVEINLNKESDEPVNLLALPLKEKDIALQLDWEVFPREVTLREIQEKVAGAYKESDAASIEWGRIKDLLQIAEAFDGTVYRARPRSLGTTEPYFVVEAEIEGKKFVVAENPQYGNATYILRADRAYDGAGWQEIFEQSREFARLLGAERIVHSDKRTHLERIMSNIQSQMLVKV